MNISRKWMARAITILVLLVVTAACGSSKTNTPATQTPAPSLSPATTLTLDLPGPSAAGTPEPYNLEGAITTDSGLQFLDLTAGNGRVPEPGDLLTMNFTGVLPDGTEFANSSVSGAPVTVVFGREQLLPGWEEGLGLMKAGGKAKMVLPPALAFGEQGYRNVPPNSQVIIEVELLTVEKPPEPSSISQAQLVDMDSGLKYFDLTIGEGTEVLTNTIVKTDYTVWVMGLDKNEFIVSSRGRSPVSFVVGRGDRVFPGWDQGVMNMKVGGKRYLVIPPDLAFGEQGGNGIPANATLIMEVVVLEVNEPVVMTKVAEDQYTTTASGLKYYDAVVGEGLSPTPGQTVSVHYTGWLEDGQVFDSSVERGEPFSFVLGTGSVIPGWDEGLAGMKPGGKRQLVIPPALAYGDQGSGGVIPPGATLIFDVELISVEP